MDNYKKINKCRLCDSPDIPIIWDWGNNPLANAYKNKEDLDKPEFEAPLVYFKCLKCHSVQLKFEIDSEILYKNYLYESPPILALHFKEMAKTTSEFLGLSKNDEVLDIGSNNGLLLKEYQNLGYTVCGVEPAEKIAQKARNNGIPTIGSFFHPFDGYSYLYGKPKLIVSTNCFAHNSSLDKFVEGLKIIMDEKSYFVFENAYLLNTLKNRDLGQSYFEHFFMHSVYPLKRFFDKHGLELFHTQFNNVQMGTVRGYVRWKRNLEILLCKNTVYEAIQKEREYGLDTLLPYNKFKNEVDNIKIKLINKLKEIKNGGGTISVFAWPAKMSLISKYFGIESYIDYVIEESESKIGKFAPGTKLEIKNVDYFKSNLTTHCILGAYNYEREIKEKQSWYKGIWINPLNS